MHLINILLFVAFSLPQGVGMGIRSVDSQTGWSSLFLWVLLGWALPLLSGSRRPIISSTLKTPLSISTPCSSSGTTTGCLLSFDYICRGTPPSKPLPSRPLFPNALSWGEAGMPHPRTCPQLAASGTPHPPFLSQSRFPFPTVSSFH